MVSSTGAIEADKRVWVEQYSKAYIAGTKTILGNWGMPPGKIFKV